MSSPPRGVYTRGQIAAVASTLFTGSRALRVHSVLCKSQSDNTSNQEEGDGYAEPAIKSWPADVMEDTIRLAIKADSLGECQLCRTNLATHAFTVLPLPPVDSTEPVIGEWTYACDECDPGRRS